MTALIIAYMIIGATFSAWIVLEHVVDAGEPFIASVSPVAVLLHIIALAAVTAAWPLGLLNTGEYD